MVMAYYGVDTDPKRLNDAIGRAGYDAGYNIYWSAVRNVCHDEINEMSLKEDNIPEKELIEAMLCGVIIENYTDDKPFPSCLVFGRTGEDRPLHIVCAYSKEDDAVIIITAYEPDVIRWVDYTVVPKLPSSEHNSQPRHHPATITS